MVTTRRMCSESDGSSLSEIRAAAPKKRWEKNKRTKQAKNSCERAKAATRIRLSKLAERKEEQSNKLKMMPKPKPSSQLNRRFESQVHVQRNVSNSSGILEPQRNEDVKVIFNACKILPEDSKHYSVVYHISAKNDVSAKKKRMYGELRERSRSGHVLLFRLQSRQCIIISSKDPVRSPESGCRILYKKRGQRMLVYDAR